MKMKPVPPADLWEFLEAENQKYAKPKNAFTIAEYAQRFNLTASSAFTRVETLSNQGKVKYLGKFGPRHEHCYEIVST